MTLQQMFAIVAAAEAAGLSISPVMNGDSNIRVFNRCHAGAQCHSGGIEYEATSTGAFSSSQGNWLDAGSAADVWIEPIVTSGSWNSGPATGSRWQLSTTRSWLVWKDTTTGSKSVTGSFKFWDAASGGSLIVQTASATWTANFESGA